MFFSFPAGDRRDEALPVEKTLVPAAWPSGIAPFGSVTTCNECAVGDACDDWLKRVPGKAEAPPPFCPNASELSRAKPAGRG